MSADELAELKAELARLRGSLRYQAADLIAEAASSRQGVTAFPGRAVALFRRARAVRAWRRVLLALECGLPNDPLRTSPLPPLGAVRGTERAIGRGRTIGGPVGRRLDELRSLTDRQGLLPRYEGTVRRGPGPIAYVSHAGLPDRINGYTQRTHALVNALSREGEDIVVLVRGGKPGEETELDGVRYRRIGAPLNLMGYEETARSYAALLERQLDDLDAGVVHAASNHLTGQAAGLSAAAKGIPFVYEVRGLWEATRLATEPAYEGLPGFRAQRAMEIGTARAAAAVLTNGEPLRDLLVAGGVEARRVHLAPNGCDADHDLPSADERARIRASLGLGDGPVIGFVGSLTAYEGIADVLHAAARLCADHPSLQLLFVGDGPERRGLERLAADLGLAERVVFTGMVNSADAALAIRAVDVAPIVRTGTVVGRIVPPLKPLEAMANGAALVLSDLPPLAPLGADGRARMVRPGDRSGLGRALRELIENEQSRSEQARTALDWVRERRSWPAIARDVLASYPDR